MTPEQKAQFESLNGKTVTLYHITEPYFTGTVYVEEHEPIGIAHPIKVFVTDVYGNRMELSYYYIQEVMEHFNQAVIVHKF